MDIYRRFDRRLCDEKEPLPSPTQYRKPGYLPFPTEVVVRPSENPDILDKRRCFVAEWCRSVHKQEEDPRVDELRSLAVRCVVIESAFQAPSSRAKKGKDVNRAPA